MIWESHAICAYLVDKYAEDDSLYPKDLQLRAKCNQRLFFDASSLFVRLRDCSLHILRKGGKDIPQDKIDPIYDAYEILEAFLATDPFLVGDKLTIADICVSISAVAFQDYAPIQTEKYPKTSAWLKRISRAIPFFDELNATGVEDYRKILQAALEKNRQS